MINKILSIIIIVFSILLVISLDFENDTSNNFFERRGNIITGNVINSAEGCCGLTCTTTSGVKCPGEYFYPEKSCNEISECNLGCCIDKEGNCYTNYLKTLCDKQGDYFVGGRECFEYKWCMLPPEMPARQTGFMFQRNDGIMMLETTPNSGKIGTEFSIEITTIEKENLVELEINASGQIFKKLAYDDGMGGDRKKGDGVYTTKWVSQINTKERRIIPVSLQVLINGERKGNPYVLFLSPTSCVPSLDRFPINETRTEIIFGSNSILFGDVRNLAINTMSFLVDSNFDFFLRYDVNHVEKTVNSINELEQECNFLRNPELIVMFDKNEKFCTQNGNKVTLSHELGLKPHQRRAYNGSFIDDFCKYFTTQKREEEIAYNRVQPPRMRLTRPANNFETNEKEILIEFSATDDQSKVLRYSVHLNSDYNRIAWGYMESGSTIIKNIPVEDGNHELYVIVKDTDRNIVGESAKIQVDFSKFKVFTDLETDKMVDGKLSFSFNYTHNRYKNSTYHIFNNKRVVVKGNALRGVSEKIELNLPTGEHLITVVVYDNEGRRASSPEYLINSRRGLTNLITGNMIYLNNLNTQEYRKSKNKEFFSITGFSTINNLERLAPPKSLPFDDASEEGYRIKEKMGDYTYKPVDRQGQFEPSKLCGVDGADTGVRYRPEHCMGSKDVDVDVVAIDKEYLINEIVFSYSYFVKSCEDDVFFDVYLTDDNGYQQEIYSGVVDTGYSIQDSSTITSAWNYTMICLSISDPDANLAGYYEGMGVLEIPKINNSGNGKNVSNTNSTNAWFIPSVNEYHVPTIKDEGVGKTFCLRYSEPEKDEEEEEEEEEGEEEEEEEEEIEQIPQCRDGIDNDGDGWIDMSDFGCTHPDDDSEVLVGEVCDNFDETKFRIKSNYKIEPGKIFLEYDYELYACFWNIYYGVYLRDGDRTLNLKTSTDGTLLRKNSEKYKSVVELDRIYKDFCIEIFVGDPEFGKKCVEI